MSMTIYNRLKFTRRLYNLTQAECAKALNVNRAFISMLENNKGGVNIEYMERAVQKIQKLGQAKQNVNEEEYKKILDEIIEQSRIDKKKYDKRYKNGNY